MKTILRRTLLTIAFLSPASAQITNFTSHCEGETSSSKRDEIREAHAWVHDHLDEIWEEIDRGVVLGSPNYTDVSSTRRTRFEREIEVIRVNCEKVACHNDPLRLGRCQGGCGTGFGV